MSLISGERERSVGDTSHPNKVSSSFRQASGRRRMTRLLGTCRMLYIINVSVVPMTRGGYIGFVDVERGAMDSQEERKINATRRRDGHESREEPKKGEGAKVRILRGRQLRCPHLL